MYWKVKCVKELEVMYSPNRFFAIQFDIKWNETLTKHMLFALPKKILLMENTLCNISSSNVLGCTHCTFGNQFMFRSLNQFYHPVSLTHNTKY